MATNLNVDYSHVEYQAQQLVKHDRNVHLVLGQLINGKYLDDIAEQINEKLQGTGTISISTIAKDYNLPADFLFEEIIKRLGKFIEGFQDEHDPKVILTPAFMSRYKARIRGVLTAIGAPTPVSTIVKEFGFEGRMFFNLAEEMIRDNTIKGSITGGRQVGKATYIPANYAKAQNEWIDNFFAQNGYLEYDALNRIGISDPKATIKRKFANENITFLSSCCIGPTLRDLVEIQIEEAMASQSYVDIVSHVPSILSTEDTANLLNDIMNSGKYDNASVFCETIVVSKAFLNSVHDLFKPEITAKATQTVQSGKYANFVKSLQSNEKMDMSDLMESKQDKKEERRKKAAEGKAGGGAQGRETKTKSAKNKKGGNKRQQKNANYDSDDDDQVVSKKPTALEFMSLKDLSEKLGTITSLQDATEELWEELAQHFRPGLNKQFDEEMKTMHQSSMNASMQNKRRSFQEFQEKINSMVENIKLFEKGLQCFDNDDDKDKLEKYLLKTLCNDLMNEALSYVCQENDLPDNKDLNPDQRNKLISQLPKDCAQPLAAMNKSLDKIGDFIEALEDNLTPACDVTLKKSDRKKDRQIVFNHRQSLMQQLEQCQEPALTLHLASLVIFQCQTGCMIHASGKFVPTILSKVTSSLDEDAKSLLLKYQELVMSSMSCKDPDEKGSIQKQLEESLRAVKDAALNSKKQAN